MKKITIKDLLDAGIHFGHRTNRWNPKMSEFIFGHRNGIHIIDLQQTIIFFNEALKIVEDFAKEGKNILFVGTKRQASDIIEKYAREYYPLNENRTSTAITNVPVKINIVTQSSGATNITESNIIAEIEEANSYLINSFLEMNICDDINYIADNNLYAFDTSEQGARPHQGPARIQ